MRRDSARSALPPPASAAGLPARCSGAARRTATGAAPRTLTSAARRAALRCATGVAGLVLAAAACTREATPAPTVACDVGRAACEFTLAGDSQPASIDFSPRPIPTLRPIAVTLRLPRDAPATAALDFRGVDMDMGFNRITLRRDANGVLRGEALLPVCVSGAMRWHAELQIDGRPPVRFAFYTGAAR